MKFNYINRDFSWLMFNYRVLQEAKEESLPLYERIKFLAIYSNNLEEFYRVRVSYYRSLLRNLPPDHPKREQVRPDQIISRINTEVGRLQIKFHDIFENSIVPQLEREGVRLLQRDSKLTQKQEAYVNDVFQGDILPYIQPVLLVKQRIKPFLRTGQIYIMVKLYNKKTFSKRSRPRYGIVKLVTDHNIPRFVELPNDKDGNNCIMFLEDVTMRYIQEVYPGYVIGKWFCIKMTRDADLEYDDQEGDELIDIISNISTTRQLGYPNRFQYDRLMPDNMLRYLMETFSLTIDDLVKAGDYHNFRDFFSFPNPKSPLLELPVHKPLRLHHIDEQKSLLEYFECNELMLHFPYQSYDYFLQYLNEAAIAPDVVEIKSTQYRVADNSAVVNALIKAANNGKKVTVFVELKARFDEENNLRSAKEMKRAGINIIYSISGLKVHAKVAMVVRENAETKERLSTCFLGTGNFNEKTAKLYGDHGFFTSDSRINKDIVELFRVLEQNVSEPEFMHILVPNYNMVSHFEKLIAQEMKNAKAGKEAYILLKMNGLEDPYMIDRLYEASLAGVKIDIIVRGVCCLKTNQKYSKNIRAIRIVDRFLEHARIFVFHNDGEQKMYMGSADWMRRNLYRRIECVFPVYNESIKQEVMDILDIQLKDNTKASLIDEKGANQRINDGKPSVRSQHAIYEMLKQKTLNESGK